MEKESHSDDQMIDLLAELLDDEEDDYEASEGDLLDSDWDGENIFAD